MSQGNIYACTPRETRKNIVACVEAGLVPFVKSSPGMGKSSLYRSVAREFGLFLIDHRLSTSAPEDLSGLPEFYDQIICNALGEEINRIRRARFVPFDIFPVEGTPIPAGYEGWMLFLDEANSGTKMVQAASYKLTLDKHVGQIPLHERVAMGMAGNHATDRAIVQNLSTAMQSRVVHIDMIISHKEWYEDVALTENYDPRVIAFLNWKEEYLMDFRPDHQENTFCCPRTWEFVNKLCRVIPELGDEHTALLAGTITSGVAAEFVAFSQVYKTLAKIDEILRAPMSVPVPTDSMTKWAIISMLVSKTTGSNFGQIADYVNRFDIAFRVLYFKAAIHQDQTIRSHPLFSKAMIDVNRYINGK